MERNPDINAKGNILNALTTGSAISATARWMRHTPSSAAWTTYNITLINGIKIP